MADPKTPDRSRLLIALLVTLAAMNLFTVVRDLPQHPAGIDFMAFRAGGQVALAAPGRLYDFEHVTALQGLDVGPGALRPYINPPSALLLFTPLSRLSFWPGYGALMLLSLAALLLAARRVSAPWWLVVLPMVPFAIFCGQVTLLVGGLVLLGLSIRERPWVAGLCFALAGAIKPQVLVLLPLALVAQGGWLTILATGVASLGLGGLSVLAFGSEAWLDWLAALPRFQAMFLAHPTLPRHAITPYAWLAVHGVNGAWAWLLAPVAAWGVWTAFRNERSWPDRLIALLGGGLLISPYAMNYELALLAPAVAAYLARTDDRRWLLYAVVAVIYAVTGLTGVLALLAVLALPILARTSRA